MSIVNLEHRCPVCNTLFRLSYDKTKLEKGLDGLIRCGAMISTAMDGMGGYTGKTIADIAINGRDILIRQIAGRARYKFKCPKCNYESQIIY